MGFEFICFCFQEAFSIKVSVVGLVIVAESLENLVL